MHWLLFFFDREIRRDMLAYSARHFSLMGGLQRLDVVFSGVVMWAVLFWRCKVMRACDVVMRRRKTRGILLPAPPVEKRRVRA